MNRDFCRHNTPEVLTGTRFEFLATQIPPNAPSVATTGTPTPPWTPTRDGDVRCGSDLLCRNKTTRQRYRKTHGGWLRFIITCLCFSLANSSLIVAQSIVPSQLQINILEGEGALNNTRQRDVREPIVQVQDENHKPIAGALVVFSLPDSGPGGTFLNGAKGLNVQTDVAGQAAGRGFMPNDIDGKYEIRVEARYQGHIAHTTIHQSNSIGSTAGMTRAGRHAINRKAVLIGAAIACGVAIGIAVSNSGGGYSPQ